MATILTQRDLDDWLDDQLGKVQAPETAPEPVLKLPAVVLINAHWIVRAYRSRLPGHAVAYSMYRVNMTPRDAIMVFDDREEAIFHAQASSLEFDGDYGAKARHRIDAWWESYRRAKEAGQSRALREFARYLDEGKGGPH